MSAFRRAARSGWTVVDIKHNMGQTHLYSSKEMTVHRQRTQWARENCKPGEFLAAISNVKFRYAFKNHSDATMFSLAWV